jgi:hypothetical protein
MLPVTPPGARHVLPIALLPPLLMLPRFPNEPRLLELKLRPLLALLREDAAGELRTDPPELLYEEWLPELNECPPPERPKECPPPPLRALECEPPPTPPRLP